jgi:sugar lactone lactonase YvrE
MKRLFVAGLLILAALAPLAAAQTERSDETQHRAVPDLNIRDFGATGDGVTLDTKPIQAAIDAAHDAGGGQVRFPAGRYLSGTIRLRSRVSLYFDLAARLVGTTDLNEYQRPQVPEFLPEARWGNWHRGLIIGEGVENVTIAGPGTIDGNRVFDPRGEERMRGPHTIVLVDCRHVVVRDLAIVDSANYAVFFQVSDEMEFRRVRFIGGWDGIHWRGAPERWCRRVKIVDCEFETGDDAIAGRYWDDTLITGCTINSSCNGIRLIGPATRLIIHNNLFYGPGARPHLTSRERARNNMLSGIMLQPGGWDATEGPLDDVLISNNTMRHIASPLNVSIKPGNSAGRIVVSGLDATGVYRSALSFESWADSPIAEVVVRNTRSEYAGGGEAADSKREVTSAGVDARPLPAWGVYARHVQRLALEDVRLSVVAPDRRPVVIADSVDELRLDQVRYPRIADVPPVVALNETTEVQSESIDTEDFKVDSQPTTGSATETDRGVTQFRTPDFSKIKPKLYAEVPGAPEMEPWSEAPVWRNGEVFFSNRPLVRVTQDRQPLRYLNLHVAGTFLRASGHILACDHFHKALLDIAPDGQVRVVVDRGDRGEPLRGLNDLTADAAGNVYWTDPTGSGVERPIGRIYRLRPDGQVELLADDLAFPNGIEVDPESRHLYVVESQTKRVLRYQLPPRGEQLGTAAEFFDFGPDSSGGDGMCFDAAGNLWVAEFATKHGTGRVVVLSSDGQLSGEIKLDAKLVTNVAFGGQNHDEIFISTGGPSGVFHTNANVKGFRGHPVPELKLGSTLHLSPLNEPISTKPDRPRYAELRIYHVLPGKQSAADERLGEPLIALKRRHGLNPLAYWTSADRSTDAPVVVELFAPPSAAASQSAWQALAADPEFAAFEAAADATHGPCYSRSETVRLLAPADAWNIAGNSQRPSRTFDLRLYTRAPGKESVFRDRWDEHAVRIYKRHGMDSLGWWEATDTEHPGVFVTLFAHENLEAINRSIGQFHQDGEWIAIEKQSESNGPLRTGVTAYKLVPTSFSPIK